MEEELTLDSILSDADMNSLFDDSESSDDAVEDNTEESVSDSSEENSTEDTKQDNNSENTTEVDVETLFTDPEGVSSEIEDLIEEGKDESDDKDNSSPNNFYSSLAKALKEEEIFPDLDVDYADIKDADDIKYLIELELRKGLNNRYKRIDEALNAGVQVSDIKKYENTLSYLYNISNQGLEDESSNGEKLRQKLIYQDYINRGFSPDRATKEVKKSFNSANDVEDAKEALNSIINHYNTQYNNLVETNKKRSEEIYNSRKEQAKILRDSILDDGNYFGDVSIDKSTRLKIYDNISKPVYRDPNTGETYTALQMYEKEHKNEFLKNIGTLFTLTNGFTDLKGLVNSKVRKEVKKGLRELENTINGSSIRNSGNLKFVSGVEESDPESFITKGWNLDV